MESACRSLASRFFRSYCAGEIHSCFGCNSGLCFFIAVWYPVVWILYSFSVNDCALSNVEGWMLCLSQHGVHMNLTQSLYSK